MISTRCSIYFALLVWLALALPSTGLASLGEHERTIEADRQALNADKSLVGGGPAFHVYELHTAARQTVREYVTAGGNIFAITWRGARQPDVEQLLGGYYKEYFEAELVTAPSVGRAPKRIDSTNISVVKYGHMGDVHGKAFLPQLMPDGVSIKDLK